MTTLIVAVVAYFVGTLFSPNDIVKYAKALYAKASAPKS